MKILKNKSIVAAVLALINFGANFLLFVFNYNKLATPFLYEAQRVANADFIMSMTVAMFALESLILGLSFFLVLNWQHR